MVRLDRAVCNSTDAVSCNLYSDHSPVIVYTQGQLKLNTDGCARGNLGVGGFGGLLRDNTGLCLFGYAGKLENTESDEAELWGVYRGLTVLMERNLKDVAIESDSMTVVKWMNEGGGERCPHRGLIENACYILRRNHCSIQYTPCNSNQCADWLANYGSDQSSPLVILEEYPTDLGSILVAEMVALNVGTGRACGSLD